jgi:probable rRNA maturation factor
MATVTLAADLSAGHEVDVTVAPGAGEAPDPSDLRGWVQHALEGSGRAPARPAEISVHVVDEEEIAALNRKYRGKHGATNVLSFPMGDIEGLPGGEPIALGDIVVCAGVVAKEAREQGKAATDHWAHMLVHGTLHLLGFDHEDAAEAAEMEGLEARLLAGLGIPDPYTS